jgi:hypothetical protein
MKILNTIDEKDLLSRDYLSKIKGGTGSDVVIDSLDEPGIIDSLDDPYADSDLPVDGKIIDSLDEPVKSDNSTGE